MGGSGALWSAQLAAGEVSPGAVVQVSGAAAPPGQLTSVVLSAPVRQALDAYVQESGATIRDVVQATLVAFLVDRHVMDDPRPVPARRARAGSAPSSGGKGSGTASRSRRPRGT